MSSSQDQLLLQLQKKSLTAHGRVELVLGPRAAEELQSVEGGHELEARWAREVPPAATAEAAVYPRPRHDRIFPSGSHDLIAWRSAMVSLGLRLALKTRPNAMLSPSGSAALSNANSNAQPFRTQPPAPAPAKVHFC